MVFNIDNNKKKCQNKISIFLKDHRTLRTGVMAAEYSVLPSRLYYLGLCDIFDLITKRWCSVSLTVFLFNCLHTKSVLVTQFLKPDTQTPEPHTKSAKPINNHTPILSL